MEELSSRELLELKKTQLGELQAWLTEHGPEQAQAKSEVEVLSAARETTIAAFSMFRQQHNEEAGEGGEGHRQEPGLPPPPPLALRALRAAVARAKTTTGGRQLAIIRAEEWEREASLIEGQLLERLPPRPGSSRQDFISQVEDIMKSIKKQDLEIQKVSTSNQVLEEECITLARELAAQEVALEDRAYQEALGCSGGGGGGVSGGRGGAAGEEGESGGGGGGQRRGRRQAARRAYRRLAALLDALAGARAAEARAAAAEERRAGGEAAAAAAARELAAAAAAAAPLPRLEADWRYLERENRRLRSRIEALGMGL